VFVKVYITGDLPAGFKRLENATRDLLNEFRSIAGNNVQYEFEDPLLNKSPEEKKKIYEEMAAEGLQPTNVQTSKSDAYSEKIILPGATVFYRGKETTINLLLNDNGVTAQKALNNSVARLESKFITAIKKLDMDERERIGLIRGQGDAPLYKLYDFLNALNEFYQIDTLNIHQTTYIPSKYKSIIIAKPTKAFTEQTKFIIDQYIMNGGTVLWLLDNMRAGSDSVLNKASFLALDMGLNLDDQLFTYGVRLNPNLLMDLQCNPVPLLVNYINNQPEFRLFPCYYYPVFTPYLNHIINKEIDAVQSEFVSTLDTATNPEIKKTVLLCTSRRAKTAYSPWQVDFRILKHKPDESGFNKSFLPVAVLLEGSFTSVFKNRLQPDFERILRDSLKQNFLTKSVNTRMIVISDGDIALNEYNTQGRPYTLGYFKYTQDFFSNKNFLLNCIDYLTNRQDRILTRAKDIKLRLLDVEKVKAQKLRWQLINVAVPVLLIILFGIGYAFVRIRRYGV
jgi:gliding-associated putative ABC transporter substrate-binding component GldG